MHMFSHTRRGFTLIELLVVVIIIAVLAAIAVPQYKHAVLKSRFSAVMPMAKSVADANEVYYQGRQMYALSQDELDVTPVNAENTQTSLSTQAEEDKYAYVAANRTDVPGVRYIIYQKYSPMFAGNIHCEADETNAEALWLCEKGLNGTEIPGSVNKAQGDYKTFLLGGTVKATDKLPTPIEKVAKSVCDTSAGCTYTLSDSDGDGEDDTINTETCGDWKSMKAGTLWVFSKCESTQYDAEGNKTNKTYIACPMRQYWDEENHNCLSNTGRGYILGENGEIYGYMNCSSSANSGCSVVIQYGCSTGATSGYLTSATQCSNGVYTEKSRNCSYNDLTSDLGCPVWDNSNNPYLGPHTGYDKIVDGNTTTYLKCQNNTIAADGSCVYSTNGSDSYRQITTTDGNNNEVVTKQCCPSGFTGTECNDGWVNC